MRLCHRHWRQGLGLSPGPHSRLNNLGITTLLRPSGPLRRAWLLPSGDSLGLFSPMVRANALEHEPPRGDPTHGADGRSQRLGAFRPIWVHSAWEEVPTPLNSAQRFTPALAPKCWSPAAGTSARAWRGSEWVSSEHRRVQGRYLRGPPGPKERAHFMHYNFSLVGLRLPQQPHSGKGGEPEANALMPLVIFQVSRTSAFFAKGPQRHICYVARHPHG